MKLSDYVVQFIETTTDSVFLLSGGGIMHLVDSLGRSKKLHSVCCHHEQAVVTAAEGYARIKNDMGVALVTTGPGGTNAITGAASAWLDSIPILIINGQVKTSDITPKKNGKPVVRAVGFQELNVLDLIKPISKYAETVTRPEDIRFHLEKAVYLAKTGRPGPSWVEIPLDIQKAEIDPLKLRGYSPPSLPEYKIPIKLIIDKLESAKRPLLMAGNGIRLAGAEKILWKLINKLNINVVTPLFTADDLVTCEYQNYLGRQGMWGNETANWAVDNCDLLLVIGERLQLTQTSYDYKNFATQAVKIMVDIDKNELHKKTLDIDIAVHSDAKIFLEKISHQKIKLTEWPVKSKKFNSNNFSGNKKYVNAYQFLEKINGWIKNKNIVTSNAMTAVSTRQVLDIDKGQRFIVNAGLGQMGQGLPMAIGACLASGKKPTVCFEGDGSLMLNIQELQTVIHHRLPIILFIYNNNGYWSIRNTHRNYFNKIFASDPASGVSIPDYSELIPAWGFEYARINNNDELDKIKTIMEKKFPVVCEIMIDPNQPMQPTWSAGKFRKKLMK